METALPQYSIWVYVSVRLRLCCTLRLHASFVGACPSALIASLSGQLHYLRVCVCLCVWRGKGVDNQNVCTLALYIFPFLWLFKCLLPYGFMLAFLYFLLPFRNCCYVECSHLVVKHSRVSPSSPPLQRGSSLGLSCSSCLVQVFLASNLQSLPFVLKGLLGRIIHTVYISPHNTVSDGRACLHLSIPQPSVSACVYWIGLASALPTLLHPE